MDPRYIDAYKMQERSRIKCEKNLPKENFQNNFDVLSSLRQTQENIIKERTNVK